MNAPEKAPEESAAPGPAKPNPLKLLTNHFLSAFDLVNCDGHAYAVYRGDSGSLGEIMGVPGVAQPFGAELRRKIVRLSDVLPGAPLSRASADTVLLHLDAKAHEGPETAVALRFHHDPVGARVCVDLGRRDGHAVTITAQGWHTGAPPHGVIFRRSHATKPLPEPLRGLQPGGALFTLAELLALEPESEAFRALLGWIVSLPFAGSVRPGILLVGPYGSGKSTRLRLATSVVEPSDTTALGSAFGRNFADDQVRALKRSVPLWDNLTSVSGAVSDELCTLITGTARETRALYSDNDMNTAAIQRPVGLTAVGVPAGLRPDALDRLIAIDVPPIARRVDDDRLQQRFDVNHAGMLGGLCDAVSAALRFRDHVEPGDHRMAAHARTLAAVDAAVEAGQLRAPSGLLAAYVASNRRMKERTAVEDVFGGALLDLVDAYGGTWSGKASELILAAGAYAGIHDRVGGWPSSARRVPEVLNHLREGLGSLGVSWSTTTVRGSTRYLITRSAEGVASA